MSTASGRKRSAPGRATDPDALPPRVPPPGVQGHDELRDRLRGALENDRFPQSLLLHGPSGVGKQTLGLWTAALLQCEQSTGCGECRSCRLASRLEHPDIHWYFPMTRPKDASGKRKLKAKLEEARQEALARYRSDPLGRRAEEGVTGIYMAAVEQIRIQASKRPAMGPRSIFVIGEADRMVPQSSSPEAANAFLKLLEEPPSYVHLILTSSLPDALLPTIRSRSTAIRTPPLPTADVAAFLERHAGASKADADRAARIAQGSIGGALRLLDGQGDDERRRAIALLEAAVSSSDAARFRAAAFFGAQGARGPLAATLDHLSGLLRDALAAAADRSDLTIDVDSVHAALGDRLADPAALECALERVEEARVEASGNVNPQVLVVTLLFEVARAFGIGVRAPQTARSATRRR